MSSKLLFIISLLLPLFWGERERPIVSLSPNGPHFEGISASDIVDAFLGIPFAIPPTGHRRFLPPEPLRYSDEDFDFIFDASHYSLPCVQPKNALFQINETSENCLYLNIWKPRYISEPLPVMVFLYGGGFFMGTGNNYDGQSLVEKSNLKSIVITLNYRLGSFGFLGLKELFEKDKTTGNYGILDQRLALEWTRDNIERFGGDPKRVTIFGESAGGESVVIHYVNSDEHDLFQFALLESGVFGGSESLTLSQSIEQGENIAENAECRKEVNQLECLQKLSQDDLLKISLSHHFAPVPTIDGFVLKTEPKKYIERGFLKNPKSILVGTNGQELAAEICGITNGCEMSLTEAQKITESQFGIQISKKIWSVYNVSSYSSPSVALINILSDNGVICPSYNFAQNISKISNNNVYLYSFIHEWNGYKQASCSCQSKASHTEELIFLWPNWFNYFGGKFTNEEQNLADQMKIYWTNFAESGDPNSPQTPKIQWKKDETILLDLQISNANSKSYYEKCSFWEQVASS